MTEYDARDLDDMEHDVAIQIANGWPTAAWQIEYLAIMAAHGIGEPADCHYEHDQYAFMKRRLFYTRTEA